MSIRKKVIDRKARFCNVCVKHTDHIIFKQGKRFKKQCRVCNIITDE